MKYCNTAQGSRVAYHLAGPEHETPLVLLHGFCEDQTIWSPLEPGLGSSATLQIDLPGFGASDLPSSPAMEVYAAAVLDVLDAEKIARCVMVGHSMGGYVALEFAARWPERLAGLGLFHSHPFEDSEERKTARQRGIETLQGGKRDLYVAQLFPNLFAPKFLEQNASTVQHLIAIGKKQTPEGISTALQAMMTRRDHQQTLKECHCPTLFLLGGQDTLVPPAQALGAALLPSVSDLHYWPEAAHMAMFECPEDSEVALHNFWQFCLKYSVKN
jgi:pimeloyl-ACP methyl ester carboxylesterase